MDNIARALRGNLVCGAGFTPPIISAPWAGSRRLPTIWVRPSGGENFEVDEMYPAYMAVAKVQEEKQAMVSIHYALEAEKIHASMYEVARAVGYRAQGHLTWA